jgi:hypothetical protein
MKKPITTTLMVAALLVSAAYGSPAKKAVYKCAAGDAEKSAVQLAWYYDVADGMDRAMFATISAPDGTKLWDRALDFAGHDAAPGNPVFTWTKKSADGNADLVLREKGDYFSLIITAANGQMFSWSGPCKLAPAAISPEFSKTAILALVAVHTDATGNAAETHKALVEAEAAATSPAEEAVVKQLKQLAFANVTAMLDLQTCSLLNTCKPRDTSKADACYTAWKASLRNLDAGQPSDCVTNFK